MFTLLPPLPSVDRLLDVLHLVEQYPKSFQVLLLSLAISAVVLLLVLLTQGLKLFRQRSGQGGSARLWWIDFVICVYRSCSRRIKAVALVWLVLALIPGVIFVLGLAKYSEPRVIVDKISGNEIWFTVLNPAVGRPIRIVDISTDVLDEEIFLSATEARHDLGTLRVPNEVGQTVDQMDISSKQSFFRHDVVKVGKSDAASFRVALYADS